MSELMEAVALYLWRRQRYMDDLSFPDSILRDIKREHMDEALKGVEAALAAVVDARVRAVLHDMAMVEMS